MSDRTPQRTRVGRSARKERATASGFKWLPPDAVPGAELSAQTEALLRRDLDVLAVAQMRRAAR